MRPNVEVIDIPFTNVTFDEMISILSQRIKDERKTFVVTANPEIVMYADQDDQYKEMIKSADYIVPDGIGIVLAGRILNTPIVERVAGFDLMMKLLELADSNEWKVYLLGGRQGANEKAAAKIRQDYPRLNLVGTHHGFFDWNDLSIQKEIQLSEPDLVFVALGFPKQEKWIFENLSSFTKGIFIGVGGSIDVLAGEVKRAPEIWRNMKLEWFYRLLKQPSRWKRMLAIPKFLIRIFRIKIAKK